MELSASVLDPVVHAEVEALVMADAFRQLLAAARQRHLHFQPLGDLLPPIPSALPTGRSRRGTVDTWRCTTR